MSFLERLENTILYIGHHIFHAIFIDIPENWDVRKYVGKNIPDLDDIAANMSLIITNTHFTFTHARPTVPGLIEVGGLHLAEHKPEVSKKFFLDNYKRTKNK